MFSCANEHRSLPKQGYTCCLALDGVNVLASGFEEDEKVAVCAFFFSFLDLLNKLVIFGLLEVQREYAPVIFHLKFIFIQGHKNCSC